MSNDPKFLDSRRNVRLVQLILLLIALGCIIYGLAH